MAPVTLSPQNFLRINAYKKMLGWAPRCGIHIKFLENQLTGFMKTELRAGGTNS
jgi:hypothetical protein